MSNDSGRTLDADTVGKTVRRHFRIAVAAVSLLTLVLFVLVVCAVVGGGGDAESADLAGVPGDAAPADLAGAQAELAVSRSLLIGCLLLALAYIFVLLFRLWPFRKKSSTVVLTAKRKELYEALTPERYIIAGSTVTLLFVIAVAGDLLALEQATTILVGIAFVTPLGVLLNKWGELGEYYDKS